MAEDKPVVRNKGMLLVAALLGVVTVVLYNIQVKRVQAEAQGEKVYALVFQRNVKPNERLNAQRDLELDEIRVDHAEHLGDVVLLETPDEISMVADRYLKARGQKGDYLRYSHISSTRTELPSSDLPRDMVARPVQIDKADAPGDILRVGDYVNLHGVLSLPNQAPRAYRIISGVRVTAVGGRGLKQTVMTKHGLKVADTGQPAYQSLTIEVPPDESLLLTNVLTHVHGDLTVELVNPDTVGTQQPRVSDLLRDLPARVTGRGYGN